MPNIQLNQEIYQQLKKDIINELRTKQPARISLAEQELRTIQRRYFDQLKAKTKTGSCWDYIRRVITFLMGCQYVRNIPDHRVEEMKTTAIELIERIINAEAV